MSTWLQWGRGFAATEGPCSRAMISWPSTRFNGAVASQPRKVHPADHRGPPARRASMGPWLRSHGRSPSAEPSRSTPPASMGPWLRSHGRLSAGHVAYLHSNLLQWGRGFAATEGPRSGAPGADAGRLQWGRGFAATEGRSRPTRSAGETACFNGAVASQPRKGSGEAVGVSDVGASMGPWLRSHGRLRDCVPLAERGNRLQWGRGFAATEGSPSPRPTSWTACFNGAVASQPRKAAHASASASLVL